MQWASEHCGPTSKSGIKSNTKKVSFLTASALQAELISGDQNGNIRVWDLTANCCSRELVRAVDNRA
jgi:hypothetical protein